MAHNGLAIPIGRFRLVEDADFGLRSKTCVSAFSKDNVTTCASSDTIIANLLS